MYKRILSLILMVLTVSFAIVGCGKEKDVYIGNYVGTDSKKDRMTITKEKNSEVYSIEISLYDTAEISGVGPLIEEDDYIAFLADDNYGNSFIGSVEGYEYDGEITMEVELYTADNEYVGEMEFIKK